MTWTITYTKGGVDKTLYGYSRASIDMELSGIGTFEIEIPNPSSQMLTDIVNNTEIKITAWSNSLYGYVKEVRYDGLNKLLKIIGIDYGVLLQNMYVHTDNTTQEDGTLSSGYSVVYTSKAFNTVAGDILTNTGITAGTITNYGTTSYKFQHKTVLDVIKYLASYANYDWNITTGKALNMGARLGSATSVYSFNTNINCSISNISDDGQSGGIYKIKVLGSGQGTSQIYGEWTSGSYSSDPTTGRNKVKVFMDNSISSNAIATQIASNLGAMLNGTYTSAMFSSIALNANVQLGDAITLTDAVKGGQTLRVMRIHRSVLGKDDVASYEVIDNAGRLKKMNLEDFLNKNKNLTEVLGSTAQGTIKTYTIPFENKGDSTNKIIAQYTMPTDCTSTDNILKASLYVERGAIKYDTTTATGSGTQNTSLTGAGGSSYAENSQDYTTGLALTTSFQSYVSFTFDETHTQGAFIWCIVYPINSASDFGIRIKDGDGNIVGEYRDITQSNADQQVGETFAWYYPYDTYGMDVNIEMRREGSGVVSKDIYGYAYSITTHTHPVSNPSHTNPITQGINVPSEASLTIVVDLNATNVYSHALSVGDVSGTKDITTAFKAIGLSGVCYAYPSTDQAYLKGNIVVTYIDTNP